jgi:hypothetical protein
MPKSLLIGTILLSILCFAQGCTQHKTKPLQTSLENFCEEFPMSASCPDGKNAIAKQATFCKNFPMSASCPDGKNAMDRKSKWCADFPNSAVCN